MTLELFSGTTKPTQVRIGIQAYEMLKRGNTRIRKTPGDALRWDEGGKGAGAGRRRIKFAIGKKFPY